MAIININTEILLSHIDFPENITIDADIDISIFVRM